MKMPLRSLLLLSLMLIGLSACDAGYRYAFEALRDRARDQAGLARKQIELPDGLRYAYLEGGKGEPLLLLHGFGGNKDNFVPMAQFLTSHYRVIIPDHIGFGESSRPQEADYAPPAQVRRLHALMQALGVSNPHVGGNSMGGMIALTYAALYPFEVPSLWLLDSAGIRSGPESELGKIFRESGKNPLVVRNADELAALLPFAMHKPPSIPRPFLEIMAQEHIRNAELEQKILPQLIADQTEERIAGLAVPALIVWGDKDRLLHVGNAAIMHRLLPRSEVLVMPEVGHMPMLEQPKQSASDYLRFRASLQARRPAGS